jgi:hypothetical protein
MRTRNFKFNKSNKLRTYYAFNYGSGEIETTRLTSIEFRELKCDYSIFSTRKAAERFRNNQ